MFLPEPHPEIWTTVWNSNLRYWAAAPPCPYRKDIKALMSFQCMGALI